MHKMNCKIGAIWTNKFNTPFVEIPMHNGNGISKLLFERNPARVHVVDGVKYLHYDRVVYGKENPLIEDVIYTNNPI